MYKAQNNIKLAKNHYFCPNQQPFMPGTSNCYSKMSLSRDPTKLWLRILPNGIIKIGQCRNLKSVPRYPTFPYME